VTAKLDESISSVSRCDVFPIRILGVIVAHQGSGCTQQTIDSFLKSAFLTSVRNADYEFTEGFGADAASGVSDEETSHGCRELD
jgi:hypothetical protein